jgi:hypothetical protein
MKLKIEVLREERSSEIDFELYDDILGKDNWDDFEFKEESDSRLDSFPVNIDSVIELLNSLKAQGANYISIDYHCDHIGYDIEGLKITKIEE